MTVHAFCEPSTATPYSRIHIREVGPEGLLPGGGIKVGPLCNPDRGLGWDVREATVSEVRGWLDEMTKPGWRLVINPICRPCAESFLIIHA